MRTVVVVCVVTAFVFIGPSAWASLSVPGSYMGVPVDQYNGFTVPPTGEAAPDGSDAVGVSWMMAQTFKANVTGTLKYIAIGNTTGGEWVIPSAPTVRITDVDGTNRPGSTLFGSTTLGVVPAQGWIYSSSVSPLDVWVEKDTMYSIVLSAAYSVSVGTTSDPESYSRGALWVKWESNDWESLVPEFSDIQFRTYVVPVPLPAGVLLGLCAVSVAGWHLRRQRA